MVQRFLLIKNGKYFAIPHNAVRQASILQRGKLRLEEGKRLSAGGALQSPARSGMESVPGKQGSRTHVLSPKQSG